MGVIVLMMIVVCGDDTQALRDTISSLCSLNKVGQFASCCGSYDNGATITLEDSAARSCFISDLKSTTGSVLTGLGFRDKGLSVLGKDVFSSFTKLSSLSFQKNSLASIESGVFNGLNSLMSLSFDSNKLTSIPSDVFNHLTLLKSLNLQSNSLESLHQSTFANVRNLVSLDLHSNKLSSLPSSIFYSNINLRSLALNGNGLTSLPDGIFSQVKLFTTLDLSFNSLAHIDMGNTTATFFYLQSNYLVTFHHDDYVLKQTTLKMTIQLDDNCLIQSKLPSYQSTDVELKTGTNQGRCVDGTCTNQALRDSGCFLCSNEKCVTCIENYTVRDEKCVECSQSEVCPFNNSNSQPSGATQIHFNVLSFIISVAIALFFI